MRHLWDGLSVCLLLACAGCASSADKPVARQSGKLTTSEPAAAAAPAAPAEPAPQLPPAAAPTPTPPPVQVTRSPAPQSQPVFEVTPAKPASPQVNPPSKPAEKPTSEPATIVVTRAPEVFTVPPQAVAPAPQVKIPLPEPEPAAPRPTPRAAVYRGPASGVLNWSGQIDRGGSITIDRGNVSTGSLNGSLPGVPVMIDLDTKEFAIAEVPGPSNNWNRIVIRSKNRRHSVISIHWSILQ